MTARKRELQFDGDVVIVTGASQGLGRCHALALARAGARVVVNARSAAADGVVDDIRREGGSAIAVRRDIREGRAIADATLEAFGSIDAMVLNAGIVRDRAFARMSDDDWSEVVSVNLGGARACLAAAWPHMLDQGHGRVVITASSAGLHGNRGQANYAASKGALLALSKTLAEEGRSANVCVNALAPVATTPMTNDIFALPVQQLLAPELVSPIVVAMCHRDWQETGQVVEAGGGWVGVLRWQRSPGVRWSATDMTARQVIERWTEVSAFSSNSAAPTRALDAVTAALGTGWSRRDVIDR